MDALNGNRNLKLIQENVPVSFIVGKDGNVKCVDRDPIHNAFVGKDGMKRAGDALQNAVGKKRILGDITNKAVTRSQKSKGEVLLNKPVSVGLTGKPDSNLQEAPILDNSEFQNESLEIYTTACEDSALGMSVEDSVAQVQSARKSRRSTTKTPDLPPGVDDFDASCGVDPYSVPNYASDVFRYYKECESVYPIVKYLERQPQMTKAMRAILVDWMVEVQESFELNHETLYLAVKLVDLYLMKNFVNKSRLQLVGATCVFLASKFDERLPPLVDDFLYICDDSYTREDMLQYEIKILKSVNFQLGMPLSYRFLRRYARCARISMELLTLARFILETALMDYEVIDILDSKLAAAALCLALKMKKLQWTPTLQYYSEYPESELGSVMVALNKNISGTPNKHLRTIRTKYSHPIFFEVAKIPALDLSSLSS